MTANDVSMQENDEMEENLHSEEEGKDRRV